MKIVPTKVGVFLIVGVAAVLGGFLLAIDPGTSPPKPPKRLKYNRLVDHAVQTIRGGRIPNDLEKRVEDKVLDAILARLMANEDWASLKDRSLALIHLSKHARKKDADFLYSIVLEEEVGSFVLQTVPWTRVADTQLIRRIPEDILRSDPKTTALLLDLLSLCQIPTAAAIAEELAPGYIGAGDVRVVLAALNTLGAHRVWEATEDVIDLSADTDLGSVRKAALVALGEMNEVPWGRLPSPDREKDHTLALLAAVGLINRGESIEASRALLLLMTESQLNKFLGEISAKRFVNRNQLVSVAAEERFHDEKGRTVHLAFLASPDDVVVARILHDSPHRLDPQKVGPLVMRQTEKLVQLEGLPGDATIPQYAAWRLEREVKRARNPFPNSVEERQRLVGTWRKWWLEQE